MGYKAYRSSGGVVIDPESRRVLLLDRLDLGEVRLPKGHIDPGEDEQETALREVGEESGYADLEILSDLGNRTVEFDSDGDHYVRDEHYFLMALRSDAQIARPEKDAQQFRVRWVSLDKAAGELTFREEREVVERALTRYRELRAE